MLLVNITANPCKITYDDANSFGMTRVTLNSVMVSLFYWIVITSFPIKALFEKELFLKNIIWYKASA